MGTKTTAKDMVKLIDEIVDDFQTRNKLSYGYGGKIPTKDYEEQAAAYYKKIKDKVDRLLQYSYSEVRTEEIIKQIIEQSKADLIKVIQADKTFSQNQKSALEMLHSIKQLSTGIHYGTMSDIVDLLYQLRKLLVKKTDIAEAVQLISQDLEKLMQTLRETER